MSNASLQCTTQGVDECPGPQLCQDGVCECFWRYGLTGDACDQWTTRAVLHVTGRTLSLAIFLAAGLHTALVLTKVTGYRRRRTRSTPAVKRPPWTRATASRGSRPARSSAALPGRFHSSAGVSSSPKPGVAAARDDDDIAAR